MISSPLKIIFAGTPLFAAHHLHALINSHHDVVAVYTQPDRPAGRGKKLTSSAVKQLAQEHQLPIEQPITLKEVETQNILREYQADVMVVVAYGLLLPQVVLDIPRFGCLNVHGSLLPRWRGAAPIQRAIEAGDTESGITIMQMDKGLDTGDMLLKVPCAIENRDTSASLHDKLMTLGAPALLEVLAQLSNDCLAPEVQDDNQACYAEKITKQEADIQWVQPATTIIKKIHAFNPFPIAYTWLGDERIKIHHASIVDSVMDSLSSFAAGEVISCDEQGLRIACGQGSICVEELQLPNKKVMTIKELLNGYGDKFHKGQCVGRKLVELNAKNS